MAVVFIQKEKEKTFKTNSLTHSHFNVISSSEGPRRARKVRIILFICGLFSNALQRRRIYSLNWICLAQDSDKWWIAANTTTSRRGG